MNEQELAERIAAKLDRGLDDLSRGTLYRLRLAREAALSRLHTNEPGPRSSLSGIAGTASPRLLSRRVLIPLFALILALSGLFLWEQETPPRAELAELDAQVLGDELPVTAYLDQGFETWLHHHSTD